MKATLNTRASAFAQDFDRELTRAYLLFQLEPLQPRTADLAARIAARYDRWQATARFPRMIKDVYVVAAARAATPRRCSASTRRRGSSSRRSGRRRSRRSAQQLDAAASAGRRPRGAAPSLVRTMHAAGVGSVPALVVPDAADDVQPARARTDARRAVRRRGCRYTVLLLDARLHDGARCCRRSRSSISAAPATASTISSRSSARPDAAPVYHSVGGLHAGAGREGGRRRSICSRCGRRTSSRSPPKSGGSPRSRPPRRRSGQRGHTTVDPRADRRIGSAARQADVVHRGASTRRCRSSSQQTGPAMRRPASSAAAPRRACRRRPRREWRLLVKHPSGSLESGGQRRAAPEPDRQLEHPRRARRQRRAFSCSRPAARRNWRASRWSSSRPSRTSCARRSP